MKLNGVNQTPAYGNGVTFLEENVDSKEWSRNATTGR
jgi:hypothetical protein